MPSKTVKFSFNFMRMGLKPMLEKKLKAKKCHWVRMSLDRVNNRIDLTGFGERNGVLMLIECEPLKLSEHQDWETAAMTKAKKHLPPHKQIDRCFIAINYKTGTCKSEIFFVNMADKKQKMDFETTF